MKKVLFIISQLYGGGAERTLSNLATHFPDDWEIDLLINNADTAQYPYKGRLITLGIEKENLDSIFFHCKLLLKRIIKLRRLKNENGYEACISFLDSANIANILTGNRRCKVIVSVHSSLVKQGTLPQYKYIVNPLVKLLYNKADRIVAVSDGVGNELIQEFSLNSDKLSVIENGCDIDKLQKLSRGMSTDIESMYAFNKKMVVASGRLVYVKGYLHLIRAFTQVLKQIPDVMLVILGEGELEKPLKKLVKDCDIADNVLFTGFIKNPYCFVAKADVFVMTSLYEGFPNALAEAVCLGVPCIATDFQAGAREILAPDMVGSTEHIEKATDVAYGVLVPMCSGKQYFGTEPLEQAEQELANAMIVMLQDQEKKKYYQEQSIKRSKTLAIDVIVNKWLQIIEG